MNTVSNDLKFFFSEMIAKEFIRKYKADPRETKRGKTKLKINAENAKHVLSSLDTANCYIESLHEGIDYNGNLSRSRFELEFSKVSIYFDLNLNSCLYWLLNQNNSVNFIFLDSAEVDWTHCRSFGIIQFEAVRYI